MLGGIGWFGAAATGAPQELQNREVEARGAPHFAQVPSISSLLEIVHANLHKTHSSQLTRSAMRLLESASPRQSNEIRGIPRTSTGKFASDAGHGAQVEAEVVDGVERRAQRLLRDEEVAQVGSGVALADHRSEEHTSELQSLRHLV